MNEIRNVVSYAALSPAMRAVMAAMDRDMHRISACANWRRLDLVGATSLVAATHFPTIKPDPRDRLISAIGARSLAIVAVPRFFRQFNV
jgi:hypothetical protein